MRSNGLFRILSLPPNVLIRKFFGFLRKKAGQRVTRFKDRFNPSYASDYAKGRLHSFFSRIKPEKVSDFRDIIFQLCSHYLDHRFDLLGSGWVQVRHGMKCRGLEGHRYNMGEPIEADPYGLWLEGRINRANVPESKRVWRLVSSPPATFVSSREYVPIDWHLDFKSGYRWRESVWYLDVSLAPKPGVDIKVPRELARMQHLPHLAWAFALAKDAQGRGRLELTVKEAFAEPYDYALEFRNQILDFIAINPPRFGVNWSCTMDVAIRSANWLVAYDLFKAFGVEFDSEFETIFHRSVYEHGRHIVHNLEWSELFMRSNHYLSDIAGLLFVAAYLPQSPETDVWLAFAVQDLVGETEFQFLPDGGNFEASTNYHRLSAEVVVYATALVLGLPDSKKQALRSYDHTLLKVRPPFKPAPLQDYSLQGEKEFSSPFPPWFFERIERMAEFTMHITKPDNRAPQIGDNDSGRFLKVRPVYAKLTVAGAKERYANLEGYEGLRDNVEYLDEDVLDHHHLVAAADGLFGRADFEEFLGGDRFETGLIRNLAGGVQIRSSLPAGAKTCAETVRIGEEADWESWGQALRALPEDRRRRYEIPTSVGKLRDGLRLYGYPDFGLYIYKSENLYLAVRCVEYDPAEIKGHSHNDNLSIELSLDGEDVIADPGSYLYTPAPGIRNRYRSVTAHFVPRLQSIEPADLRCGLFWLTHVAKGACRYFGEQGFVGTLQGPDWRLCRMIRIENERLVVTDGAFDTDIELVRIDTICQRISSGYGKRKERVVCAF